MIRVPDGRCSVQDGFPSPWRNETVPFANLSVMARGFTSRTFTDMYPDKFNALAREFLAGPERKTQ